MHHHSQCLDKQGRKWKEGRAWWHFERNTLMCSWYLLGNSSTALFLERDKFGDPNGYTFHIAIYGLFAFWIALEGIRWEYKGSESLKENERVIGFSIFSGAIWLYLWTDRSGWGPDRTKVLHYTDWILGRTKYSSRTVSNGTVLVAMPEGTYQAKYTETFDTWKRPRWKAETAHRFEIDFGESGIPIPGKGENAWDMDDDELLCGIYVADTLVEAAQKCANSANRTRERYGGSNWQPKHD